MWAGWFALGLWSCSASTALHVAAAGGDVAAAENAVKSGANVEARDGGGTTPLGLAVASGNVAMVRLLIDHGADVNARQQGKTPLMLVDHADVAALLIERGGAIDAVSDDGLTALMFAAAAGRADLAALLLERGARADVRDRSGKTVMHHAAMGNSPALTGALVAAGGVANAIDGEKQYPLHLVGARNGPPSAAVVATLIRAGNPVDAKDGEGRTALCRLASSEAAARVLIDAGADPNADCGGDGPLLFAAAAGNRETLALLMERGAGLPTGGPAGARLLCVAAETGLTDLVSKLLASGVAVDATDGGDATALHRACMRDRLDVARLLLRHGADPQRRASSGAWPGESAATCSAERPAMRELIDETPARKAN